MSNFLFSVRTYAEVVGISSSTEWVKLAITLLTGKTLTWWRSVAQENWAMLGVCDWAMFSYRLGEQFRDLHHVMRMRRELSRLR